MQKCALKIDYFKAELKTDIKYTKKSAIYLLLRYNLKCTFELQAVQVPEFDLLFASCHICTEEV